MSSSVRPAAPVNVRRRRGTGTVVWHEHVGKWMAQFRLRDGRRPTRYFEGKPPPATKPWRRDPRPPEALRWLDQLRMEQETGTVVWSGPRTTEDHIMEWWGLRAPHLTVSTAQTYRKLLKHLSGDSEFMGLRLDAVRSTHVQGFLNRLLSKGLASKTVRDVRGLLNQPFTAAWNDGLIARNPVTHATVATTPKRSRRAWTPDEAGKFLVSSGKLPVSSGNFSALWYVLLLTGMRQGEARGLRWSDIDFEQHTLAIRRHVTDYGDAVIEDRKSGGADVLPMAPALEEALRIKRNMRNNLSQYIFHRDDGRSLSGAQVRYAFNQACKDAGLVPLTPHELRHTAATLLADAGVPLLTVASILGHSSTKLLSGVYHHGSDDERRKALEALSDRLSG